MLRDFRAGPTTFFGDPKAFEALSRLVIPALFREQRQVRVTVVGCGTGEEAYSIAILLAEHASTLERIPDIRIFATDNDEQSLAVARKGCYPEQIDQHVSSYRLQSFFAKNHHTYQIRREIRDLCFFSKHRFFEDPPFSRVQLICCRNVISSLDPLRAPQVLARLNYALQPDGYLFLGTSESVDDPSARFRTIDDRHRIFQKKGTGTGVPLARLSLATAPADRPLSAIERHLLWRFTPDCIIVDHQGVVIYGCGPLGQFLGLRTGARGGNVFQSCQESIRSPLRKALNQAVSSRERTFETNIPVAVDNSQSLVSISVEPIEELSGSDLLFIVTLLGTPEGLMDGNTGDVRQDPRAAQRQVESLTAQLAETDQTLSSVILRYQDSEEELQSSNEEFEAVNAELRGKVVELDAANGDLRNLLESTQIATIFLDGELKIRTFTQAAGRMFRLGRSDIGRPLADAMGRFADDDLLNDSREVLVTHVRRERQVTGRNGASYQRGALPYRNVQDVVSGVVLTFVDVTRLKQAEQSAHDALAFVQNIVDTVREPLVVLDASLRVASASKSFYDTFHMSPEQTIGRRFFDLGCREWDTPGLHDLLGQVLPLRRNFDDYSLETEFSAIGKRTMLFTGRRLEQGVGKDPLVLLTIEDISARVLVTDALRDSERRRRDILDSLPMPVYTTDSDGRLTMFNQAAIAFSGRVPQIGVDSWCVSWKLYGTNGELLPRGESPLAVAIRQRNLIRGAEAIAERPDGTRRNFVAYPTPLYSEEGALTGAVNVLVDITELRKVERERIELIAREQNLAAESALHEAQRELAHVSRSLIVGELATSIAHEVIQPLAAMVTNAEVCRRWLTAREPNLPEACEALQRIVRDGNRASDLIRRIRRFLKNDSRQLGPLNINLVIEDALALGQAELSKGGTEVYLNLTLNPAPVLGDRVQLQQVVLNLLMNASEAKRSAEEEPRVITVISKQSAQDILVMISDNGEAPEPQLLHRIFDPFFTTKSEGMGMGLSISRSIVEAHGGRIWAERKEGPGTTVLFSLPLEPAQSE